MLTHPAIIATNGALGLVLEVASVVANNDGQAAPLILAMSGLVASFTSLGTLAYTVLRGEREDRRRDR